MTTSNAKSNANQLADRIEGAVLKKKRLIEASIKVIAFNAISAAPHGSGTLKRGIISFMNGDVGIVGVRDTVKHARAIHEGSGLHSKLEKKKYPIRPKHKKALSWKGLQKAHESGDAPLPFTGGVMHPGVKPQPYLTDGLKNSQEQLKKIASNEGVEFARSIAR